jgi:hypothetical protein
LNLDEFILASQIQGWCNNPMNVSRDVTPQNQEPFDKIKRVAIFVFDYLRHPIEKIKNLPDWNWLTLITTLICTTMFSGILTGLVPPNFFRIIGGIIISPLVGVVATTLGALFIYYYFQVYEKRTCSFRKIFTLLVFANIPFFVFQVGSEIIPPITLVGFAFTAMLMAVGLTENFQMDKKHSLRLVSILLAIVFILWLWNRIDISKLERLS